MPPSAIEVFTLDPVTALGRAVDDGDLLIAALLCADLADSPVLDPAGLALVGEVGLAGDAEDRVLAAAAAGVRDRVLAVCGPDWAAEVEVVVDLFVADRARDLPLVAAALRAGATPAQTGVVTQLATAAASAQSLLLV